MSQSAAAKRPRYLGRTILNIVLIIFILGYLLNTLSPLIFSAIGNGHRDMVQSYVQGKYGGRVDLGEVDFSSTSRDDSSIGICTFAATWTSDDANGDITTRNGYVYLVFPSLDKLLEEGIHVIGDDLQEEEIIADLAEDIRESVGLPSEDYQGYFGRFSYYSKPIDGRTFAACYDIYDGTDPMNYLKDRACFLDLVYDSDSWNPPEKLPFDLAYAELSFINTSEYFDGDIEALRKGEDMQKLLGSRNRLLSLFQNDEDDNEGVYYWGAIEKPEAVDSEVTYSHGKREEDKRERKVYFYDSDEYKIDFQKFEGVYLSDGKNEMDPLLGPYHYTGKEDALILIPIDTVRPWFDDDETIVETKVSDYSSYANSTSDSSRDSKFVHGTSSEWSLESNEDYLRVYVSAGDAFVFTKNAIMPEAN